MALYIIRPWETLIPELSDLHFERFAYLALLIIVLSTAPVRLRYDGPTIGILSYVAALCISALLAYDTALAWSAPNGLYVFLTKLLALILIVTAVRNPYELFFLVAMAVMVTTLYAGKSLWEFLINDGGRWSMGVHRLTGISKTFGHPNALASLIVPTLPWWLFLVRWRKPFVDEWPRQWKSLFNYFLLACPLVFLASILFSGSRAGFAAVGLFAMLACFASTGSRFKVAVIALVLGVFVWTFLDTEYKQRFRSIWDSSAAVAGGEESKQGRILGFLVGYRLFQANPITGVGIGNFRKYRVLYDDGASFDAHNIPGQLLGETGLVGTAAFCYMLWSLVRTAKTAKNIAAVSNNWNCDMLAGLGSALCHTIVLLLFLGLAGHWIYQFTWIWLAAFSSCILWLAKTTTQQWDVDYDEMQFADNYS